MNLAKISLANPVAFLELVTRKFYHAIQIKRNELSFSILGQNRDEWMSGATEIQIGNESKKGIGPMSTSNSSCE